MGRRVLISNVELGEMLGGRKKREGVNWEVIKLISQREKGSVKLER